MSNGSPSNGSPVVIRSGQTVRFPVTSEDPLAAFQQLKTVSELTNLHELAFVRSLTATNPTLSTAQISAAVSSFLAAAGTSQAATINFPEDFQIEAGATVTFAGPITVITAQNFYVDGTINAHGSLNITALSFGASQAAAVAVFMDLAEGESRRARKDLGGRAE